MKENSRGKQGKEYLGTEQGRARGNSSSRARSRLPFSNEENISVSFIPTASFAPVAQQFIKPESFFLDTANCPGDGYAWFWTATNSDGAKAKYIKISKI